MRRRNLPEARHCDAGALAMLIDDDMCRCGVICTCGGEDFGEEHEAPLIGHEDCQASHCPPPGFRDCQWPQCNLQLRRDGA